MGEELFDFAMVLDVQPEEKHHEWVRLIEATPREDGMRIEVRHASLLMCYVHGNMEYEAIERTEQWLHQVAASAPTPFKICANAQPSNEV